MSFSLARNPLEVPMLLPHRHSRKYLGGAPRPHGRLDGQGDRRGDDPRGDPDDHEPVYLGQGLLTEDGDGTHDDDERPTAQYGVPRFGKIVWVVQVDRGEDELGGSACGVRSVSTDDRPVCTF